MSGSGGPPYPADIVSPLGTKLSSFSMVDFFPLFLPEVVLLRCRDPLGESPQAERMVYLSDSFFFFLDPSPLSDVSIHECSRWSPSFYIRTVPSAANSIPFPFSSVGVSQKRLSRSVCTSPSRRTCCFFFFFCPPANGFFVATPCRFPSQSSHPQGEHPRPSLRGDATPFS